MDEAEISPFVFSAGFPVPASADALIAAALFGAAALAEFAWPLARFAAGPASGIALAASVGGSATASLD